MAWSPRALAGELILTPARPFIRKRCRSPQRRDGDGETLGMGAATMQLAAKGSDGATLGERMATVWLRAKDGNGARAEDGDGA